MSPETRPPWFFKREQYGGILCDLASHNLDAYLFLTSTTRAEIVASQVGNVHHPQYPELEDFGDLMLSGDGGAGYIRVDWFTPAGLTTYGDSRLTIIGKRRLHRAAEDGGHCRTPRRRSPFPRRSEGARDTSTAPTSSCLTVNGSLTTW